MEALVKAGGVIDQPNCFLLTPLHRAALKNRIEATRWLITHGASINCVDQKGHSPLHLACYYSSYGAARLLLSCGAKYDIQDNDGHICSGKLIYADADQNKGLLYNQ